MGQADVLPTKDAFYRSLFLGALEHRSAVALANRDFLHRCQQVDGADDHRPRLVLDWAHALAVAGDAHVLVQDFDFCLSYQVADWYLTSSSSVSGLG